ncbi:MAG: N-formylglutamate amidohydrolase [Myxococcales bacterium]|nr:N-formylglutamate amidohydrolase [Myxococcales bacterium]
MSCEHGGNDVPAWLRPRFRQLDALLETHRGFDRGALALFGRLERHAAVSAWSTTSRLVIDLNRSLGHPRLFSEATRPLQREERERIVREHYLPYRQRIEEQIATRIADGQRVLHVSVHSFVAVLDGVVREAEIGLLYDPKRSLERQLSLEWRRQLRAGDPRLRVRMNYPYKGVSDGFTRYLRTRFDDASYAGIELEVNQSQLCGERTSFPEALGALIERSLVAARATL